MKIFNRETANQRRTADLAVPKLIRPPANLAERLPSINSDVHNNLTIQAADGFGLIDSETFTVIINYVIVSLFDQTKPNNAGGNIAVKIQITGTSGVNISAENIQVEALRIEPGNLNVQSPVNSNPLNLFTFAPLRKTYQYNLKTKKTWASGTYRLVYRIMGDTVEQSVKFVLR